MDQFSRVATIVIICATLFSHIKGLIPGPCGNNEDLSSKRCCPTPKVDGVQDAGACGVNLATPRGSCVSISQIVVGLQLDDSLSSRSNRENWPHYFNELCKCNGNYAGYDCGECKFGYRGDKCDMPHMRKRRSITSFNSEDRDNYINALKRAKNNRTYSRYMAIADNADPPKLVTVPLYDLFTWIHFFVGRENSRLGREGYYDYAHESGGFLTWHRLYLLWFEREMQILTGDEDFSVPYWDWTVENNREVLFEDGWFGSRKDGGEIGGFFGDENKWKTVCWFGTTPVKLDGDLTPPLDSCDPNTNTGDGVHALRRCPNKNLCDKNATTWPGEAEMTKALGILRYDTLPFSRDSSNSFRNYLEGFEASGACIGQVLCVDEIRRRLHNSVHLILGIGDFNVLEETDTVGTMADVAGAANDPLFISHHAMIDNIFEQWLQKNRDTRIYAPDSTESEEIDKTGHGANDVLVPFIPLYINMHFFQEASMFGYEYDGAKPGLGIGVSVVTMMAVTALVLVV